MLSFMIKTVVYISGVKTLNAMQYNDERNTNKRSSKAWCIAFDTF